MEKTDVCRCAKPHSMSSCVSPPLPHCFSLLPDTPKLFKQGGTWTKGSGWSRALDGVLSLCCSPGWCILVPGQGGLVQKASLTFYYNVISPKITSSWCLGKTEVYFSGNVERHAYIHSTVVYKVSSGVRLPEFKSQVNHLYIRFNTLFLFNRDHNRSSTIRLLGRSKMITDTKHSAQRSA